MAKLPTFAEYVKFLHKRHQERGLQWAVADLLATIPAGFGHLLDRAFGLTSVVVPDMDGQFIAGAFGFTFGILFYLLGFALGLIAEYTLRIPIYLGSYMDCCFGTEKAGQASDGFTLTLPAWLFNPYRAEPQPPTQRSFTAWFGIISKPLHNALNSILSLLIAGLSLFVFYGLSELMFGRYDAEDTTQLCADGPTPLDLPKIEEGQNASRCCDTPPSLVSDERQPVSPLSVVMHPPLLSSLAASRSLVPEPALPTTSLLSQTAVLHPQPIADPFSEQLMADEVSKSIPTANDTHYIFKYKIDLYRILHDYELATGVLQGQSRLVLRQLEVMKAKETQLALFVQRDHCQRGNDLLAKIKLELQSEGDKSAQAIIDLKVFRALVRIATYTLTHHSEAVAYRKYYLKWSGAQVPRISVRHGHAKLDACDQHTPQSVA